MRSRIKKDDDNIGDDAVLKEGYEMILKNAQSGDASEQYDLGRMFFWGVGTEKNMKEAIKWFDESVEQGCADGLIFWGGQYQNGDEVEKAIKTDPRGKYLLACCFYHGIGTVKDENKAIELFDEAARDGDVKAMRARGALYLDGQVREGMNDEACFRLIKTAAEQGDKEAKKLLGRMYAEGNCTEKSIEKAVSAFMEIKDDPYAQYWLSCLYLLPDSEIFSASEGIRWLKQAAKNRNVGAQLNLGRCLYNGYFVPQDKQEALTWFNKAAKQENDGEALYNMGVRYLHGDLVGKDDKKAVEYFEKAIKLNDAYSKLALGNMLIQGSDKVKKDEKRGIELIEAAANDGIAEAKLLLGISYMGGLYTPKDEEKGVKLYKEAADLGEASAKLLVGSIYMEGRYVPTDEEKGVKLYKEAADLGDEDAKYMLGICFLNGIVEKKNVEKAVGLFEEVEDRIPAAKFELGLCHELGKGNMDEDEDKALKKYHEAAKAEYAPAMNKLGEFYENARGDIKNINIEEAKTWYKNAAEAENADGQYNLGRLFESDEDYEQAWIYYGLAKDNGHRKASERFDTVDKLIEERGSKKKLEEELELLKKEHTSDREDLQQLFDITCKLIKARDSGNLEQVFSIIEDQRKLMCGIADKIGKDAAMLGDDASDEDRQRFLLNAESYINQTLNNDPASTTAIKDAEIRLKNYFADIWGKFLLETQTSLVSSWATWDVFENLGDAQFDFRAVVICATGALERELKRILFEKFRDHANGLFRLYKAGKFKEVNDRSQFAGLDNAVFKDKSGKPIIGDDNKKRIFIEKLGWLFKEDFTLGSCSFLLNSTFKFKDKKNNPKGIIQLETNEKTCFANLREEYLTSIYSADAVKKYPVKSDCFTKAVFGTTKPSIKSFHPNEYENDSLIAKIEHIASRYRNRAAHGNKIRREEARQCRDMIIGDLKQINTVLFQMFSILK